MRTSIHRVLAAAIAASSVPAFASGQEFAWSTQFGLPGVSGSVKTMAAFDDGSGPSLFVAGSFGHAGGLLSPSIAKWDGHAWASLPTFHIMSRDLYFQSVTSLAVFDDDAAGPHPPSLYVMGIFSSPDGWLPTILHWNGSWSAGSAPEVAASRSAYPTAMLVHDDGYGPALYASSLSGGLGGTDMISRWNGQYVERIASGSRVWSLCSFDDGSGPALYAGGEFTTIEGVAAAHIARYSAERGWQPLGEGLGPEYMNVLSMAVFDDGTGPALYVVGPSTAGGQPVPGVAKWTATGWSPPPNGFPANPHTLRVVQEGGRSVMYVSGEFQSAGGVPANRIARWDGAVWSALGDGVGAGNIDAIEPFGPQGEDKQLYAGGTFTTVNGSATGATGIARFDGAGWSPLGQGAGVSSDVLAFAHFDGGDGEHLYAAGNIATAGGVPAGSVLERTERGWATLPGAPDGVVRVLLTAQEMDREVLYAAGSFANAGGAPAANIAKWDGAAWSALGAGVNGTVYTLEVFDDGTGPALYAGGSFTSAGGTVANRLAKWDGTAWSRVGTNPSGPNATVYALKAFQGAGARGLYVSGDFTGISGVALAGLARWDGAAWSPVGTGTGFNARTMAVQGSGAEARLWLGGNSDTRGLASTDGLTLSLEESTPAVSAIYPVNDGVGDGVYLGGESGLRRLTGHGAPIGVAAQTSSVHALTSIMPDGACVPTLFLGGAFTSAGGTLSIGVAARTLAGPGPTITVQPIGAIGMSDNILVFNGMAVGGDVQYQWYFNNQPLADDGRITGSATNVLIIRNVHATDIGQYFFVASTPCGAATSDPASLRVFCPAEFNFDFDLNADDLSDFITGYYAVPPEPRTDWNQDGVIDADDLADYITAFFTPC